MKYRGKQIFLMAMLGSVMSFSASAEVPDGMKECLECHPDFKHKQTKLVAKDKCVTCHGDTEDHGNDKTASDATMKAIIDAKLGMTYEQFYPKSRLGDKPNPMILMSGGEFIMGTDDRLPDEGPQHMAVIESDYYLDKYEVTNLQYKRFIEETKKRSPKHFQNRTYPEGKADHPVVYVSWKDANAYCDWADKRLPTQEEWEKAARTTDGRTYPWGNEFNLHRANTPQRWDASGTQGDTTPVGSFETGKTETGLYDMSGNVWEWTSSWYKAYPGNDRITENYGEQYKVLKGGSWWDCSFYACGISAPVYNRSFFTRSTKNSSFGFRCAKDAS
jgi:formylglycine-generating enzyme required for sulfatase activity